METQSTQHFATPKAIDNLSIAGLSVWAICLTVGTISNQIDSFYIRILALSFSLIWSISLFVKNKRWNKSYNYILILVNAVLIYINAAGINTVTRQSPFEGFGVQSELNVIQDRVIKGGIFSLSAQKDWYPDYKMLKYIDTLREQLAFERRNSNQFSNQFSFIRDKISYLTQNPQLQAFLLNYLKDFGKPVIDTTDLRLNILSLQLKIDSLNKELETTTSTHSTTTITSFYDYNGKKISSEAMVDTLYMIINKYEENNANLKSLIRYINSNRGISEKVVDSLLKKYD